MRSPVATRVRTGDAVPRHRHWWQRDPGVRGRLVRLDGSERADELFCSHLTTSYVDPPAICAPGAAVAGRRHPFFRSTPHVTYWAVFLDHIRIGSGLA
jgi:hypothetical protein